MASELHLEVAVEADGWGDALGDVEALCARVAAAVFARENVAGEAAALFSDDATLRALNARFRNQDKPTNVLAFPADPAMRPFLGDLALAFETVAREAAAQRKSLDAHAAHLVTHGLLHLLGYDHDADDEAERMEARERAILADLGFADPYAERELAS